MVAMVGFKREASNQPTDVKMHMLVAGAVTNFCGCGAVEYTKWQDGDVNQVAAGRSHYNLVSFGSCLQSSGMI